MSPSALCEKLAYLISEERHERVGPMDMGGVLVSPLQEWLNSLDLREIREVFETALFGLGGEGSPCQAFIRSRLLIEAGWRGLRLNHGRVVSHIESLDVCDFPKEIQWFVYISKCGDEEYREVLARSWSSLVHEISGWGRCRQDLLDVVLVFVKACGSIKSFPPAGIVSDLLKLEEIHPSFEGRLLFSYLDRISSLGGEEGFIAALEFVKSYFLDKPTLRERLYKQIHVLRGLYNFSDAELLMLDQALYSRR